MDNEKTFGNHGAIPPGPPPPMPQPARPPPHAGAPQLNVRPVTEFAPDLNAGKGLAAGAAAGGALAAGAASRNLTRNQPDGTAQNGAGAQDPFRDPVNPFSNQAEASSPPSAVPNSLAAGSAQPQAGPAGPSHSGVEAAAAGAAGGVMAAAAVGAASTTNDKDLPQQSEAASRPESPMMSEAGVAAGAGAAAPGPSNVHRVQMDFNPSMDDELSLQSGQLVRLLHEYDDGWVCSDCSHLLTAANH